MIQIKICSELEALLNVSSSDVLSITKIIPFKCTVFLHLFCLRHCKPTKKLFPAIVRSTLLDH